MLYFSFRLGKVLNVMLILMVAFESVAPGILRDRIPELLTLIPILAVGLTDSRIVSK